MAGPIAGADATESLAREHETRQLELAERRYDAYMADVVGRTLRRLATVMLGAVRARARRRVVLVVRTLGDRFAPPGTDRRAALGARFRRLVPSSSVSLPHQRRIAAPAALSDDEITTHLSALARTPTVDVVVVGGAGSDATLAAVRAQRYPAVESIVVEPPVGGSATGSVEATVNAAVAAATGEFVVVLEAGDRLAPHALIDLVAAVQDGADAAYGDEDRVDENDVVVLRDAKPLVLGDETLLSYDVVGAPLLVRRSLFCELGGLDERCHPVAAHDFALRLSEATDRIEHVAEVLCSRPESNAADPADATAATIDVVRRAIERRGGAATVWAGDVLPSVRFTVAAPDPAPSVAIVIPTRDRLDLLRACVESVRARSTYPNYSILICDNDSKEPATLEWLEREDAIVVKCPGPFNYAAIVNRGVAHTDADFVVTLNNDTTIATPDWLERLVGLCSLPKVGSVGVKLAYPDGRLQHEGVGIIPMPVHLSRDVNYDEVDRWLTSTRNAAAVTGACQIVRSTAWRELGGLDEQLAVGYNDVDFCLRLGHKGWRVAYTPEVVVEHRESASRGNLHPIADVVRLVATWDLLSSFADPCVPGAVRDAGRSVDAGPPSGPLARTGAWPVPRLARPGEPTYEPVGDPLGAARSSGAAGWTSRHVADAVRQVLDDRPDPPVLRALAPQGSRRRGWLRGAGARGVQARRGGRPIAPYATRRYRQYYAHTRPSASALRSRTAALDYLEAHPTVSVVVAIGPGEVSGTLESLRAQVYDRTEVLVAGGSKRAARDGVVAVGAAGSVEATVNAAVAAATGEFVVVLEAGDRLAPHALIDLVAAVQDGADAAYGDEDRVDENDEHGDWHLKPAAYGRITALSYDVVGAPLLVRRSLFCELGGLDERCHPVAAHDFALRLSEATDRIEHVAEVLCSRPESNAADPADATAATIDVVRRAIERRGGAATVWAGDVLPSVRFTVAAPDPAPSVAIVIPTRDRLDLLRACVESVRARSTYPNYSILICDNDSKEPATLEWLEREDAIVVKCPGPFNYAAIVNRGVAHTDADFVVTLNNDTTIATPDWLERLVGLCSLPKVGSVGVKLAYPDGRLQHEGVGIIPMPVHLSRDVNYDEVDRWLTSTRNAAAVTGACQIVRSTAWRELGGLDEQLAVAFNDVDFGMRLCAAGYDVAYTPEVTLGHRESASRGDLHPPADEALLISRWDLLGGYVDPSMPVAMRLRGDIVEFDPRADVEASR